jgi:hypothetical protein
VAVLAAIALAGVPGSGAAPPLRSVGLEQGWSMFAPDPIAARVELDAELRLADGRTVLWHPPAPGALVQERGYRWAQWTRAVASDDHSELWAPAARWIARTASPGGARPVSVTLRRRFARLTPPGASDRRLRWSEFDFYTLDLR